MAESSSKTSRKTVCIFGAMLTVGNQGCRALSVSLVQLLSDMYPDGDFYFLYGHKEPMEKTVHVSGRDITVHILNSRLSPKSKLNQHLSWILLMALLYRILPLRPLRNLIARSTPWIDVLDKADFIGDIRGGDSFSDIYGIQRIFWGSMPCFITILMKKRLVLLPQTYGPYKSATARVIARFIFSHADRIIARDLDSISVVKSLLGKRSQKKRISFCPDVAFVLEPNKPDIIQIEPPLDGSQPELIGLNISGLLYHGGYTGKNMFNLGFDYPSFIAELIEQIMEKTDAHVLLVPHVFSKGVESDFVACEKTAEHFGTRYEHRLHRITTDYDQNEIKAIIGQCNFFLGSRMHACIAALSQGIPAIGIAYSKKFLGVFESAKLGEYVIDARKMDKEQVIASCMKLHQNRKEAAEVLSKTISQLKTEVRNTFSIPNQK